MVRDVKIDSLALVADNHLVALLGLLDNPDLFDDQPHPTPFIAQITEPVRAEIARREAGLATSAKSATIDAVGALDWRLLPSLSALYESVATLFRRHPHLSDYPAELAAMLRRESAARDGPGLN